MSVQNQLKMLHFKAGKFTIKQFSLIIDLETFNFEANSRLNKCFYIFFDDRNKDRSESVQVQR